MSRETAALRPPAAAPPAGPSTRRAIAAGLVRACRPRQWLKNALVFAAPAAAGVLTTGAGLRGALVAFAAFCLAASGTYLFNDSADVEADRRHPRKRLRPIAAGIVSVRLARAAGAVLLAAGLALAFAAGWPLAAVVAAYLALTFSYTFWLKHQPVVDLVAVAGCHVVRAYAGAVAVAVPVTSWFLVVISLGSLLLVAGKREAELRAQTEGGGAGTRSTLTTYTASYLAHVRVMCSGAMIVTYCLWALQEHTGTEKAFFALSIVPFVLVVLRHALLVDRGVGEEPEELALRDRPLQVFIVMMLVLLGLGIHLT
ncbi:decaprenyl-phosphate phosphoribosyltransferase [Microbispora corallina]|uniref:Decaprenyl-phosphate phosphoribosyltransferase n=1 Tax=Microbispora corallina TaxID=83302 RepID=A0ABQ4FX83_9ACTN|nr:MULTISPECIES: decaprenyl-phosphate phosphoribosyltransferase [Microbispora]ETK33617.1 UbiA prenyltransferase [Microbispora sp. ATCC PTA-5024]GIH39430.1 decaprenyl-phosphate phosphoribosyltransferase [Microbispora corallina]